MELKITKIDAVPVLERRKRVAVYARVSSRKDAMLQSLSSQVSYYNKLIQSNNDWEFAGVYSDEAKTGTKDTREDFQRLIEDCNNGKIDLIITKSITRFARNTVTLLETVRELKKKNIDVFFEEQNLHTLSSEGELLLTCLASMSQEESRSVSENMKWIIKKNFEQGIRWGGLHQIGYRLTEDKKIVVVKEEAKIVKQIFQMYLDGTGMNKIAKILNDKGIKAFRNNLWSESTIRTLLTNTNYTGDLVLQKTYRPNFLTKLDKINNGQMNKYIVEDNHERIIDKKDFEKVQKLIKLKVIGKTYTEKSKHKFTGLLKCGYCGRGFCYKKNSRYYPFYICNTYVELGKQYCNAKRIREDVLEKIMCKVLRLKVFDEKIMRENVKEIIIYSDNLNIIYFDNKVEVCIWENPSRSNSWTEEMKEEARQRAIEEIQRQKEIKEWLQ